MPGWAKSFFLSRAWVFSVPDTAGMARHRRRSARHRALTVLLNEFRFADFLEKCADFGHVLRIFRGHLAELVHELPVA